MGILEAARGGQRLSMSIGECGVVHLDSLSNGSATRQGSVASLDEMVRGVLHCVFRADWTGGNTAVCCLRFGPKWPGRSAAPVDIRRQSSQI